VQPESLFVSGSDVYVAGVEISNPGMLCKPKLWKNGVEQSLQVASNITYTWPSAVYVANGSVYVCGPDRVLEGGVTKGQAVLWKDGVRTDFITDYGAAGAQAGGLATSLFVSGSDVYVGGGFRQPGIGSPNLATVWKNGAPTQYESTMGELPEVVRSVFVLGGDVYAGGEYGMSGTSPYYGMTAMLRKNGVNQALHPADPNGTSNVLAVSAYGDDIYATGSIMANGIENPVIWKNGVLSYLCNDGYMNGSGDGRSLFVTRSQSLTNVSLDKRTLSLPAGTSERLTLETVPFNASNIAMWSSSNNNYATVSSDGTVRAVAPGTAKITATTLDGNKTAVCDVTVVAATRVTGVTLDTSEAELIVNHGSRNITATVAPTNASNKKVAWSSSDENKVRVSPDPYGTSRGSVIAVGEGVTTITATTEDGRRTARCTVTATFVPATGLTVDPTEWEVAVGASSTLRLTIAPFNSSEKRISVTSDNPAVVRWGATNNGTTTYTISGPTTTGIVNATITGYAPGKANLTFTTQSGKTATCAVTVVAAGSPGNAQGDAGGSRIDLRELEDENPVLKIYVNEPLLD
jgi:uncharacterized protein YjdB